MTGISLGGHASFYAFTHEPRLRIAIPIIGCPDFHTLFSRRISKEHPSKSGHTEFDQVFPQSLLQVVKRTDPVQVVTRIAQNGGAGPVGTRINPFWGKKILIMNGEDDQLVPGEYAKPFYQQLELGPQGVKEMWVQPQMGHRCSPEMTDRAAAFLWTHGLSEAPAVAKAAL